MNSSQTSRFQRLQDRLQNSRYWSVSLLIHGVLIASLSTYVLVKQAPAPEFELTGEIPSLDPAPITDPLATPVELPPEITISEAKPTTPDISTGATQPALKPLDFNPRVTTLASNSRTFTVPVEFGSDSVPKVDTSALHPMQARTMKDGRNHVVMPASKKGGPMPTDKTESAVLRGLHWLRDNQEKDGSWGTRNKGAMTGLALLAFLGHGETGDSKDYGLCVNRAIEWVIANGTKYEGRLSMTQDGWGPGNGGVYEHGILTYALGEYYTMTKDERVAELLTRAVRYIVDGQGPDGGWMYHYDKTQSDTSVSGWQVQALKAAHLTKLGLPGIDAALDRAMANFNRVQGPKGGYGYRTAGDKYSLSGVGILCELFWTNKRDGEMRDGVKFILERAEKELPVDYHHAEGDLYAWYYHTQAMLMFGGPAWIQWEPKMTGTLVRSQAADGSWPVMKAAGHGNLQNDPSTMGGVYRTALSVLVLESYYRYLPLNQANESAGAVQLAAR